MPMRIQGRFVATPTRTANGHGARSTARARGGDTQSYTGTLSIVHKNCDLPVSPQPSAALSNGCLPVPSFSLRGNAVRELLGQYRRVFALSHGMAALPLGAWTRAATLMVVADRRGRCCASVNIARWPRAPMVHRQRRQLRPMVQTAVDGSAPIHLTADGCSPRLDTCHESRMLLPRCPVNAFRVHST